MEILFAALILILLIFIFAKVLKANAADAYVHVKSRRAVENYSAITFFKEDRGRLYEADRVMKEKELLNQEKKKSAEAVYKIKVCYRSPAEKSTASKNIFVNRQDINMLMSNPSILMGKAEYNRFIATQQKEALNQKQHGFYTQVNSIIDFANANRNLLVNNDSQKLLDDWISYLFDRTVNSIKKIKSVDSEEWNLITSLINQVKSNVEQIVWVNQQILAYYNSPSFLQIKETCALLMSSQRDFNDYISQKVETISRLFGTRVVRNETINDDTYNYIRLYKKAITPFTAEVSAAVFASAENNPLEYVVKYFYPNKQSYPEQIQNLYRLVEELETLKDAKRIIENYKVEYRQYLAGVPDFIMKNDESGFYSRLGFANLDDSVLTVEYKFSYTSGGGMAQRSFTIPMTEETIAELIKVLESKLTATAFVKEQRTLMTKKLREAIKRRDNFTCCNCGNSIYNEPNLLLEIDHIIPVSKGGQTVAPNLQTLCWKCNRAKSNKIRCQ